MKEKLKLVTATKDDIRVALQNNSFWKSSPYIPFSRSKALWLLQNDRIDDNDVCAVLGWEGDIIVSFIFMIPDLIHSEKGTQKIYWSLRWWVAEKHKDSILSTYTRKVSLKAIKNQVIVRYLGEEVEGYYAKQPFTKIAKRKRYFIVFNMDANLIVLKLSSLKIIKPILKIIDNVSFGLIRSLNKRITKKGTIKLSYKYLTSIDDELWEFLEEHTKNDVVPKTKSYINWQIDNNQYVNNVMRLKDHRICLLGSISNKIGNTTFSVINEDVIVGFISFHINGSEFSVRYFIYTNNFVNACVDALMENFIASGATVLQTENEVLGEQIKKRYRKVFVKEKNIVSLIHNDLKIDTLSIRDYDGQFA